MLEPLRGVNGFPICTHSIEEEIAWSGSAKDKHESKMIKPVLVFALLIPNLLSAIENNPNI